MADAEKNTSGLLFLGHIARKVFLEDWTTKLVALAITLALWVGVTGLSTPTTRQIAEVPLTLSYSNKTEITNSSVQAVNIVISGDRRKVNQVTENNLVISVDLSDVQPGERIVQLGPENVSIDLPLGVKLQEIRPNRIAVRLEAVEEKEVAVNVETTGEPAEGFEVYSETVNPARVRVRGPASYVRGLTSVPTDRIDITGKQADFNARQVQLSLSNPKATVPEAVVDVTFRIGEQRIERMLSVPMESGRRAQVTLFGPRSMLENLAPKDINVQVPENSERPSVTLPDGLQGRVEVRRVKSN